MTQILLIPAKLPSLNEMIAANRRNKYLGAKLKRETEEFIAQYILLNKIQPVERPCVVHMVFHEPTKKRDTDNVESAKKYILDALVKSGIIQGDSPKYVVASPSFTVYGEPGARVVVTIIEGDADKLRTLLKAASDSITEGEHG